MDDSRVPPAKRNRALTIALAASLAVHLAALPFLRVAAMARPAPKTPNVFHLDPGHALQRPPVPTPPPPPPPRRVPHVARVRPPVQVRAVAVAAPHANAQPARAPVEMRGVANVRQDAVSPAGDGTDRQNSVSVGLATGLPEQEPLPAEPSSEPLARPAASTCPAAPHDAHVVDTVTPDRPAIAAEEGATGRVEVRVDLAETGAVAGASVYKSSGNAALDNAAVDAARRSTYAAASDGCRTVAGSYIFSVDYDD